MSTVHHQEYLNTVYTQYVFVILVHWRLLADTNRTNMTNTYCCVYSVEILLMMDNGHV